MSIRLPYETKAGQFSEAETFMQLIEHLRLASEAAFVIGHNRKANEPSIPGAVSPAQGFLAIGEQLGNMARIVTKLATGGGRLQ